MEKILLIISLLLGSLQVARSQTSADIKNYKILIENGKKESEKRNFVEALFIYNVAHETGERIGRKAEIENLISSTEDSLRNLVSKLEYSRKEAIEERNIADMAKARKDSALRRADKIVNSMYYYEGKFALAYDGSRFGFIDKYGNIKIKYNYTYIVPFDGYNGFARGRNGNDTYLLDTTGHEYKLATNYIDPKLNFNIKAIHIEDDDKLNWKSILKCDSVEILILNNNKLKSLPSDIDKLINLKTLVLYYNEIQSVPSRIGNLKSLNFLSFYGNSLTELPSDFFNLYSLKKLDLGKNKLPEVPKEISKLKELRWLSLYNNNLTEIPAELADMKNLSTLIIGENKIRYLPNTFKDLQNLSLLNIQGNNFDTLPKVIGELNNLKYLYFTFPKNGFIYNEILDLPKLDLVNYIDTCNKYGFKDLANQIRISSLRKTFTDISSYANLSWYCMLAGDLEGAILSGTQYEKLGGDNIAGLSNLAMGYLWSGRFHDAYKIYDKYKNEKEFRLEGKLGKDIFLKDINDIDSVGIKPTNADDILKIRAFLK